MEIVDDTAYTWYGRTEIGPMLMKTIDIAGWGFKYSRRIGGTHYLLNPIYYYT